MSAMVKKGIAMKRVLGTALIAFLVALLGMRRIESQSLSSTTRLPGARPTVDAAEYPSLQAAFDALPATGGLVRLPAGIFEISEPLRISQDDVLIQGSGTATH